jgi:hypothetical protein
VVAAVYYDDRRGLEAMTGRAASGDDGDDAPVLGGALRIRLLDGRGAPLPLFRRGSRHYVEGRDGERYTIEIQNRSALRFEAVATVDGLDGFAFFGERGSTEPWPGAEAERRRGADSFPDRFAAPPPRPW